MSNESVLGKHFFYVAQTEEGYRQGFAESPDGFMEDISNAKIAWLDCLVNEINKDIYLIAEKFGFSKNLICALLTDYPSAYADFDTEMGLKVPAIMVTGLEVTLNPAIILIRGNIILTIHGSNVVRFLRFRRYADVYLRKIPRKNPLNDKLTLLMARLLDENNSSNFDHLREIEQQGDTISKWMMDPKTPRSTLGPEIYKMKHALITYLNGLWATLDVISSLRYGDAELISDDEKILRRIDLLSNDVNRQIGLSEHMSEVLASGLEVLQSMYNNQLQVLNNRMAFAITYLTILGTAVLVPNTIATVMSNTAFNMKPDDAGGYLALIIGSTVIAIVIAYVGIIRMGWMPKNVD